MAVSPVCARGDGRVSGSEDWPALSAASQRSLELQGGIFTAAQAETLTGGTFSNHYGQSALQLNADHSIVVRDGTANGPLDEIVDRKSRFCGLDLRQTRARLRVARREQGAAVLVGNDGNRIAAELYRLRRDLFFIHADERPEDGQRSNAADHGEVLERL